MKTYVVCTGMRVGKIYITGVIKTFLETDASNMEVGKWLFATADDTTSVITNEELPFVNLLISALIFMQNYSLMILIYKRY